MTAAVSTHGLGCRFGELWALRDCTFELPAGRVAAVVGPNGAGKTTLLNLLVGLLPPSSGSAKVFGEIPDDTERFLARVGFVAQDAPLYRDFSAADHLRMGEHLNPTWRDDVARGRLLAAEVPLDRPASTLSGGQRAQLALALAIGKEPDLLLLDEPLASLDPIARRDFVQSLMSTSATGTTVMLSSHLVSDLAHVCDFLIVIVGGRLRRQPTTIGERRNRRSTARRLIDPAQSRRFRCLRRTGRLATTKPVTRGNAIAQLSTLLIAWHHFATSRGPTAAHRQHCGGASSTVTAAAKVATRVR